MSQNLSVADQECEAAVRGRFREGSGWASKLIFLLSSFDSIHDSYVWILMKSQLTYRFAL